ncbi:MAG: helix-turn-helix domain-containing protein [Lacibacter sp.]|jgi:excisionase family DNA binding protein
MQNIILTSVPLDDLKNDLVDAIMKEISIALKDKPLNKSENEPLTRIQVAQLLKVSLGTVDEWTKSGKITGYRIGRRVRFKRNEVLNSLSLIKTK